MKKIILFAFALFLITFLATAGAQEKKFEFVVGGGIESPISPSEFRDGFHLGWTGKLAAGYFVSPQFNLGANLSYNRFGLDEENIVTIQNPDISGGDLTIFELAGVGKYYLLPAQRTTNFYVLGGPGVAFSRISDFTFRNIAGDLVTIEGESETDFMLTGGLGVSRHLGSNLSVFVEGRYSYIFAGEDDNASYLPIRVGLIF